MADLQVDFNQLRTASRAWIESSDELNSAATQSEEAKNSHSQVNWSILQDTWDAHVKVAQYIHDRLIEGVSETESMGTVLHHVSEIYLQQDERFAHVLVQLDSY